MHDGVAKLEQIRAQFLGQESVDLMFIIDCTGSMQSWIDQCKKDIESII
jgi:hypothetical protein